MNILIALVAMAVTLAGLILTNNRGLRQDMARDCRLPSAAMAVWSLAAVLLLAVGSPPLQAQNQGSTTYYFPHLAVGASWQTTIS